MHAIRSTSTPRESLLIAGWIPTERVVSDVLLILLRMHDRLFDRTFHKFSIVLGGGEKAKNRMEPEMKKIINSCAIWMDQDSGRAYKWTSISGRQRREAIDAEVESDRAAARGQAQLRPTCSSVSGSSSTCATTSSTFGSQRATVVHNRINGSGHARAVPRASRACLLHFPPGRSGGARAAARAWRAAPGRHKDRRAVPTHKITRGMFFTRFDEIALPSSHQVMRRTRLEPCTPSVACKPGTYTVRPDRELLNDAT